MIRIFGVFKTSLLAMGISQGNEQSLVASLGKRIFVVSIMGSWVVCMFTGAIVSDDLNVIIESFIFGMNCLSPLVIYTYFVYYKSKLFDLIDNIERCLNASKMI